MSEQRNMEAKVRRIWCRLTPDLDDAEKRILLNYLEHGDGATPYGIARESGFNVAVVYRKIKRMVEKRVIIPANSESGKLVLTIKGCIALFVNNLIDLNALVRCAEKVWGLKLSVEELLGFLYLLGMEATRRGLSLRSLTMCKIDEASIHVVRLLKDSILRYIHDHSHFEEILREIASSIEIPVDYLREGLKLALRGIARTMPVIMHTENHKVALFVHGKLVLPFAIECRKKCHHFERDLGFECPALAEEVKRQLSILVGGPLR